MILQKLCHTEILGYYARPDFMKVKSKAFSVFYAIHKQLYVMAEKHENKHDIFNLNKSAELFDAVWNTYSFMEEGSESTSSIVIQVNIFNYKV